MKLLGIDYGTKRVGVSIGDTESRVAVPLCVVHSSRSTVHSIVEIVKEEQVKLVVVGQGGKGPMEKKVQEFSKKLRTFVPVEIVDEHFTTAQIEKTMKNYGKERRKIDKDSAAAALILQGWLDNVYKSTNGTTNPTNL